MSLAEGVLSAFSRDPGTPEYEGGTARTTIDNALDFLVKTVPGLLSLIRDKDVLDFGCSYGLQALAMARSGARRVTGLDLPRPALLDRWRERTRPGGLVIISFAEPWLSPRGSHCDNFTRLPWVNCIFPEKAVLAVRSRYKQDGAARYEEIEGGLNRMTISKFERLMQNSGIRKGYDLFNYFR